MHLINIERAAILAKTGFHILIKTRKAKICKTNSVALKLNIKKIKSYCAHRKRNKMFIFNDYK